MNYKALLFALGLALLLAAPSSAQQVRLSGDYAEFRTADVYTGPCFANAEVGLTGKEAVLVWHIRTGEWNRVNLEGLSVVAVVRANATLGDPYASALPARAVMIVDARANAAQRRALVEFAQSQTSGLLRNVLAVEAAPIHFAMGAEHGRVQIEAGDLVRLSTRAIGEGDEICHNEEVYYQPLAGHLSHAMPAVVIEGGYRGNHLGMTWDDAGRRGAFVGHFSL